MIAMSSREPEPSRQPATFVTNVGAGNLIAQLRELHELRGQIRKA
jgi:hypothetical protein